MQGSEKTQGSDTTVTISSVNPGSKTSPRRDFGFIPVPKHVQYNPEKPFQFGMALNVAFGFASMITAANLYYCQPLLIQLSNSFDASYGEVSLIPTLVQAGYAVGLVLISPLGDLVRRRQLILLLVACSTALTVGLSVTNSFPVFLFLTFFVGVVTVTPQILLPLAADIAPPAQRGAAISVVLSGLLLGILVARVLAGVIAEFASWRVVYYTAIGLQAVVLFGSYILLPDYPSKNDHLTYWNILWTMAKFSVTEPILIQACLINLLSCACFSNFWVTLTFLLGEGPYFYSTLVIGLFGLIGIAGVAFGPLFGYLVDRFETWYASLFSVFLGLIFLGIHLGAAGVHVAAVIIAAFGFDVSRQTMQVSLSTSIFAISAEARSRMNAVFILALFIGQVIGTSVGTEVFLKHGWRANAGLNVAWMGAQLVLLLLRGPHCARYTWFGYEGGFEWRKDLLTEDESSSGASSASDDDQEKGAIEASSVGTGANGKAKAEK